MERYPRNSVSNPEQGLVVPSAFLQETKRELLEQLQRLTNVVRDFSRPVDEYLVQTLATEGLPTGNVLTLQPQYDYFDERIESILVTGPNENSFPANGLVTGPTANQQICGVTLPQGNYTVQWRVALGGTTAAAEQNNFQLELAGTQVAVSENGSGSGTDIQQSSENITVPAGGATLSVNAIGAGTSTATYRAQFSATPVTGGGAGFTLDIGKRHWALTLPPTGALVIAPVSLNLNRNSNRFLTAYVSGEWSLELMGWADVRIRS